MPITTKVVSLNPIHGEVYSIQHYVVKFVSDLRQVGGFLHVKLTIIPGLIKMSAFDWSMTRWYKTHATDW
jgi:hypothetical protein